MGGMANNKSNAGAGRMVAKKVTLKFAPELLFQLDMTFDQMDETRRMLAQDVVRRDAEAPDDDDDDGTPAT